MAKLLQKSIAFDTLIVSEVFIKMNWDVNAKSAQFTLYFGWYGWAVVSFFLEARRPFQYYVFQLYF